MVAARRCRRGRGARVLPACVVLLLLLGLGASRAVTGAEDAVRREHARLAAAAAKAIEAQWKAAQAKKLFAEADDLAQRLLQFAPDNAKARDWLGHRRLTDGTWELPGEARTHENQDPKALAPFLKARDQKLGAVASGLWKLYDGPAANAGREARGFILEDLAQLVPEDPRLASERTEAVHQGCWIGMDTVRSMASTRTFRARWKTCLAALPREEDAPVPAVFLELRDLTVPVGVRVGPIAVWGTCDREEAVKTAQFALLAVESLRGLLRIEAPIPEGFGILSLAREGDKRRLVGDVRIQIDYDEFGGRPSSLAIRGTPYVVCAFPEGSRARVYAAVWMLVRRILRVAFGEGPQSTWVLEGLPTLLGGMAVGHKGYVIWPGSQARTARERHLEKVLTEDTDWLTEALDALRAGELPGLVALGPKRTQEIYVLELLGAYAWSTWLAYAQGEHAGAFLASLGRGEDVEAATAGALGLTPQEAEARLSRWLEERTGRERGQPGCTPVLGTPPR